MPENSGDSIRLRPSLNWMKSEAGMLVIGPAGENLVRFANIATGDRFLGRGGMGAVLGSKNLKAIVALGGSYKISPVDKLAFEKLKKKATAYINRNRITGGLYRSYGTPANVALSLKAGILPVNNFSDGTHAQALQISGEETKKNRETSHHTCKPCTILCGKKGMFGGQQLPAPEYETLCLLGSNLGIFDIEKISEWNRICGEMGMDTISAGGTLAWVMEAAQRGLVQSDLKFGSPEGISQALLDTAYGKGFGREMAQGSRSLSEKYGGTSFAMHVKGLELAGYDPRGSFGHGLAYAVANRGRLPPLRVSGRPGSVPSFAETPCRPRKGRLCQILREPQQLRELPANLPLHSVRLPAGASDHEVHARFGPRALDAGVAPGGDSRSLITPFTGISGQRSRVFRCHGGNTWKPVTGSPCWSAT